MNKKYTLIYCLLLLFAFDKSSGQNLVNVNPLTGSANVIIPIYNMHSGQVSLPISISYVGHGVKTKDVEGTAGMGWELNAGGQISRQVRGLPDDCTFDNSSNAMVGWMTANNYGANYATTFTILNNGSNCSYGSSDITHINNTIPYYNDTEPDIFNVSAPGLNCQLIYDRSAAKFRTIDYQDVLINYSTAGGTGNNAGDIASFTITNDKGLTYVFAAPESVTQTSQSGSAMPDYFSTRFQQYLNGITYSDSWSLVSITDPNNNGITLSYSTAQVRNSTDPIQLYLNGSTTPTVEYKILTAVTPQILNTISTSTLSSLPGSVYFTFTWATPYSIIETGQTLISTISGMGRSMQFAYGPVTYNGGYARAFLTNFADAGCSTPINYQFQYAGVSGGTTTLADSTSNKVDFWGYNSPSADASTLLPSVNVNPSSSNYQRYAINTTTSPGSAYQYSLSSTSNRSVTDASVADGSLTTIINAQGGSTNITYEPNDYYDVPSGTTIHGGGVRVKQLTETTGGGSTNDIVQNYSYVNPTGTTNAGMSSGQPVALPQFAFTVPYSGTATGQSLWKNATAISAYDLSTEDESILYAYTSASQTGAGKVLYNYNIPAMYWNTSASPICTGCTTEWYPTINDAASYNCPSTNGPIANLSYSYPFIPNPNYDFERGAPIKIVSYNNNGIKASETDYSYQRVPAPLKMIAFRAEDGPGGSVAKFYNQYSIYYNTSELPFTVTKTIFDSNNLNQSQTSTATYSYNSIYHKLLTKKSETNSDNSIIDTYYKYVKDYLPNSGATNLNIKALYGLQQQNVNVPVETYQQVTRNGTATTTNATLTLFTPSTFGAFTNFLASQQFKMTQPDGAATFTLFAINTSAQTVTFDPKYYIAGNFDKYDIAGNLQTGDDNNKHINTAFFDQLSQHTTAIFANANYNEVAFNDFDSQIAPPVSLFTISGAGSYSPVGSHAGVAAGITATVQTVTTNSITKSTIAQNYIFSIWINASTAGTLTFSGASPNPTVSYTTGGWKFYEIKIPASALTSVFTLSFTSNQNISIDDILLYPDVAEASITTYNPVGHFKIAETNTNGVSSYYTNDQWGRINYVFDQDKNIVQRKQYISALNIRNFLTPTISTNEAIYNNFPNTYTNLSPNLCLSDGVTYTWDFGDGSSQQVTTDQNSLLHTYTTNGTYTITVTVNSPLFGSKAGTYNVTVISLPNVKIHYKNSCQQGGQVPSYIQSIDFIQNGVTVKTISFTAGQTEGSGFIAPGAYTIVIHQIGHFYNSGMNPTGYSSVTYSAGAFQCFSFTTSAITLTDDLTFRPNIYFEIRPQTCP